jgi:5-methylcytosine-specific restriction endonuclease McrA
MNAAHLAPTPCLETDCRDHATRYGRCEQHQRPAWFGSTRKQRLPKDWTTRRLVVLKRDKGVCYICGEPGADTIDHVIPGDDHSLHNLKAVHDKVAPHCHRTKSSTEGHQAKQGNKTKRRK